MDCLPARLVCCKRSRKEIGIQLAIEKMNKETDIIELIKTNRYFQQAFKKLLSHDKRQSLKEKSRYLIIDPNRDQVFHSHQQLCRISNTLQPKRNMIDDQLYTSGFYSDSMMDMDIEKDSSSNESESQPQPQANFADNSSSIAADKQD